MVAGVLVGGLAGGGEKVADAEGPAKSREEKPAKVRDCAKCAVANMQIARLKEKVKALEDKNGDLMMECRGLTRDLTFVTERFETEKVRNAEKCSKLSERIQTGLMLKQAVRFQHQSLMDQRRERVALRVPSGLESPPTAAPLADKAAKRFDELLASLGAETFAERRRASMDIVVIGSPAIPRLVALTKAKDPEVAQGARNAIEEILAAELARKELARPLDVEFVQTPLKKVMEWYSQTLGIEFEMPKGYDRNPGRPITLRMTKASAKLSLSWIMKLAGTDWRWNGSRIRIGLH